MKKFIARIDCQIEIVVEAESAESAADYVCDLNNTDLDSLPKTITEIYDVIEVEPVL